ncbi:uncharacterized protein LOC125454040 isoform X5 [Stegostoma tigrinum]|uniref:uncharacterized protein LOC125454040 isoform X5 n=1 Tax=Stegostoma tigrinum TaxID=3053191 RepID=UPI00202B89CA|nr:uncharacterized protein LOC125454040 isoform X5 [Stegostoma tigrinum]
MLREVDGKTCSSVSCEGGVSAVGCLTESYLHMELRSGLPPVLLHHWVASPDGLVRMRVADARWWRIAFPGKALGKRIWHFRMDKNNVSTRFLHCHNARSRHWDIGNGGFPVRKLKSVTRSGSDGTTQF